MKAHEHELPIRFRREDTAELCGNERNGGRCVRDKGHHGFHACLVWHDGNPVTWK
jgi:hypothetical protein